jgi:hypothetical protein
MRKSKRSIKIIKKQNLQHMIKKEINFGGSGNKGTVLLRVGTSKIKNNRKDSNKE